MSNINYYCVIMAGGIGRRFWPYSRKALPKQFLDFFGTGRTLLQQTYDRYKQIIPPENIYITTHRDYKELVKNLLPEVDESRLIVEEERRNTAPAIAYASHVIQKVNPDATIVVAPSDHLILKTDEFKQAILKGMEFASHSGKLLTLGIKPSYPETGYGYIQIDEKEKDNFYKVKTFIEKPAREFAEVFVQSNEFYWNSGIFIWHVNTILQAFHEMMAEVCPRVECDTPDFSACPNSSIDYSIMEKANNVYVQLCDFGWADIGTWGSLYDASPKDENRNVIVNSNTLLYNCKENIILMPEDKLAVIQDLEGYLVVERGNALLICKKDDQNAIRKFVNDVEMKFGEKYS
ncbi:mannose-1-phosphate guanylyltransferase [Bacteroides caecicola]|uniref:Mannose-1-phosphate guanylyltransferase n=2 Tax=Bacteroidaceae TaxID=815 RepID=A0ABS2F5Z2_9BACE|nr:MULTISPECIES: mannose-1-phosphate guanylyltransferase [Bacteroidaceae]MBD8002140.1 mannose-1-phosphate guanylyltransferase [Phocaeicola faecium]MBM6805610.1 mannose-1-phosphate guanylyltransferase [Bacteroides caecicola]